MNTAKRRLERDGLDQTVWGQIIINAEESDDGFSEADIERAENWRHCACGELSAEIPRDSEFMPTDCVLKQLGHIFYSYVLNNDPAAAAVYLNKIYYRELMVLTGSAK